LKEDLLAAEGYFQQSVADSERSEDEIKQACCIAAKAARLRGDMVAFLKYTSKVLAQEGCSEICYDMGQFYESHADLEEAIIWYYNAVYETQPILNIHSAKEEPLAGLVRCYCELGEEEQAESYRKELEQL